MNNLFTHIKRLIAPSRLEPEAFDAYLYRLPDHIEVSWTRDGEYLVGQISEEKGTYMTQARSGDEFMEMVNDAVYTMHDIPEGYRSTIGKFRAYNPSPQELKKLQDRAVKSSRLSARRQMRVA